MKQILHHLLLSWYASHGGCLERLLTGVRWYAEQLGNLATTCIGK